MKTTLTSASSSTTSEMRSTLIRNLVLLTLATVGTILTVAVIGTRGAVEDLSWALMDRTAELAQSHLDGFFQPMGELVGVLDAWGQQHPDSIDLVRDELELNETLWPIIASDQRISGVIVANDRGEEYFLHKGRREWSTRLTRKQDWGGEARFSYWDNYNHKQRSERKRLEYDPRERPWYQAAINNKDPQQVTWTDAYTFFTSRAPGITASRSWTDSSGTRWVVAMDLLLRDISRFTTELKVGERGFLMILTPDLHVLGLPRHPQYQDPDRLAEDLFRYPQDLNLPVITAALEHWKSLGDNSEQRSFRFVGDKQFWWLHIAPYQLSPGKRLWVVVTLPEKELLAPVQKQRNEILAVAGIALLVALMLAFLMDRSFRAKMKRAVDQARQLGQYTLEEEIGGGVMGSVYRARHSMLRRPTAIKLLHPERAANQTALSRFENEVQLTARLTHPNTVALYDYGHTPDGMFYYAMEFLAGTDLEDLLRRSGPLPPGRVIHLLTQVCGSLQEAHQMGLIHRDIKPANIMLINRGGDADFVKVLDFGLVKDMDDRDQAGTTNIDTLTGTPLYMSPELVSDPDSVGPASDIYAIGALGYFLLTGQPVFDGKNIVDICAKHIHDTPQPPSERLGKPLPADLEQLILQCLQKAPADRPESAEALSLALKACDNASDWAVTDSRLWWRQNHELFHREHGGGTPGQDHLTIDLRSRAV